MRNLFLALVLANCSFAAWHAWFSGAPAARSADSSAVQPVGQATARESKSIPLVGEMDETLRRVSRDDDETGRGASAAADTGGAQGDESANIGESRPELRAFSDPRRPPEPVRTPSGSVPGMEVAPSITMPALESVRPSSREGSGATETAPDDGASTRRSIEVDARAAPADVQANLGRCASVGPFQDPDAVTAAMETLRAAGYSPASRDAEGAAVVDYWVHLAELASRDEANEMLARLRENGVDDAYLIPGEEDGDIISLGVFRQTSRAGRLQDEVRQIGYEPIVAELTRRPSVHWIDVALEPGGRLDVEDLQAPGRITRLEQQPCPSSGD